MSVEEYSKGIEEWLAYEKKLEETNDLLIDSIGREDFDEVMDCSSVTGFIEVVDEPGGDDTFEPTGVFTEVWVDQWSVGDSGDSYAGFIYAKFGEGKWLKIPYSC